MKTLIIIPAYNEAGNIELAGAMERQGLSMVEVMVSLDSRADLGRPKESARDNRVNFMKTFGSRV